MLLYALIAIDIAMAAITAVTFQHLPPQLPLFYTRPWGEDQLADLWMLSIIPVLMHVFFFTNVWLAKRFFKKETFVARMLIFLNWFLLLSYFGIFLKVVLLVT